MNQLKQIAIYGVIGCATLYALGKIAPGIKAQILSGGVAGVPSATPNPSSTGSYSLGVGTLQQPAITAGVTLPVA